MTPIKTLFSIQEHFQKSKRSSHYDLRVLDPKKKTLWSWAFPKLKFPESGEKVLAIRTPNHPISYFYFHGRLDNGDMVSLFDKGTCYILVNKYNLIILYFNGTKIKGAYNFIRSFSSKNSWLVTKSKKYSDFNINESKTKTQSTSRKHTA